jgi:hypothetical protein
LPSELLELSIVFSEDRFPLSGSCSLAGTRERAGARGVAKATFARGLLAGIGFAPEMIAQAIMPHI